MEIRRRIIPIDKKVPDLKEREYIFFAVSFNHFREVMRREPMLWFNRFV
ncbi:MAG: hypothetical protein IJY47_06955 [Clostridia bacterium]|nr:hypothetical protein [Clostridia bacterium]